MDDIVDLIIDSIPSIPAPITISHPAQGSTELVLVLSDVHIGKKTKSYTLQVFNRRIKQIFQELTDKISDKTYSKLHILLLGDIVDGESIYPGHAFNIEADAVEQYLTATTELGKYISAISKSIDIEISCVIGNHGRTGKKGEGSPLANWDYIVYHYLKGVLREHKNIKFNISSDWYMIHHIANIPFMLCHGDGIEGMGSPNTVTNAAAKWALAIQEKWEHLIVGHFHWPYAFELGERSIFGNGTFVSDDDWALKKLKRYTKPSQKLLEVSKNGNITVMDLHLK